MTSTLDWSAAPDPTPIAAHLPRRCFPLCAALHLHHRHRPAPQAVNIESPESRLNDTGKVTLDDLTDLRKSFEAPAQPNNDDLRERCRRAEARADEAVSTIDGLRERLARAEEALSNLRATSDASSTELKARCDDADRERADEREMRARLDERVGALELSTEATQTRTTNALDDLTREHGFVLEWRARAEEQIRGLQQVDA